MNQGFGYIEDEIKIEDYKFGGAQVPDDVLMPDSDWTAFLPVTEDQRKKIETYNCTAFGTLHALQMLMDRKFGIRDNYSDRYLGIMAGTDGGGNSPHSVAETLRKVSGVIPEVMLPFGDDIEAIESYYSPKPPAYECLHTGLQWLKGFSFKHEWVLTGDEKGAFQRELLREALKHSPVAVAVDAWKQDDKGVYVKQEGAPDNHWTVLYKIDDAGYRIFDQYAPYQKLLSPDYDFTRAKRYFVERIAEQKPVLREYIAIPFWKRFFSEIFA